MKWEEKDEDNFNSTLNEIFSILGLSISSFLRRSTEERPAELFSRKLFPWDFVKRIVTTFALITSIEIWVVMIPLELNCSRY